MRTIRELATLGFFNQETINPVTKPNFNDATVDIDYQVEEAAADQVSFSAGWGYSMLILNLGLTFNNFSSRNFFNRQAWKPVPAGDGQKLSLNLATYGRNSLMYSISFTEPWLGGRKPNSLTVSFFQQYYTNWKKREDKDFGWISRGGFTIGLGKRLKRPDDYFTLYQGINLFRYNLHNYKLLNFGSGTGDFNMISYSIVLGRNSTSQPIYPRNGSEVQLSLELTPPYSLFAPNKDYASLSEDDRYKWVEEHKWNFKAIWYNELYEKLVLMSRVRFGYMGYYNKAIGLSPFHRYYLDGDGLANYNFDSREIIGMRGYENSALTPGAGVGKAIGGNIFTKYTVELRYPLTLTPQATIFVLGFAEAGNCWKGFKSFNPFDVKRSAGLGVRIYLPMFGLLGLDWGYGFDGIYGKPDAGGSHFHFSIGNSID